MARGLSLNKVGLPECLADRFAGDVEIFRFSFDADEAAAKIDGGNAGRTGTHEGVTIQV